MGRESQAQALYEFFGGWSVLLAQNASQGQQSVEVATQPPSWLNSIKIDQGINAEGALVKNVTGTGPYTINLMQPLQNNHNSGAILSTMITQQSSVFSNINTVAMYEPMQKFQQTMPLLYLTMPRSKESRKTAAGSFKFADYSLNAVLLWQTPTTLNGADPGASALDRFYSLCDEIASYIHTNKQLITPSYPSGASVRFGEDFTIDTDHEVRNNMLVAVASINISSTEQVIA